MVNINDTKMATGPEATKKLEKTVNELIADASSVVLTTSAGTAEFAPRGPLVKYRMVTIAMELVSFDRESERALPCQEWHVTKEGGTVRFDGFHSSVAEPWA